MEAGLWLLCYHGWFLTNSTPSSLAGSNLETGDGVLDRHLHTPDFTAIQALVVFGSRPPPPTPLSVQPHWLVFLPCFSCRLAHISICLRTSHQAEFNQKNQTGLFFWKVFFPQLIQHRKKGFRDIFVPVVQQVSSHLSVDPFIRLDGSNALQRDICWNLSLKTSAAAVCCCTDQGSWDQWWEGGFLDPCLRDYSSPGLEIRFGSLKLISVCVTWTHSQGCLFLMVKNEGGIEQTTPGLVYPALVGCWPTFRHRF